MQCIIANATLSMAPQTILGNNALKKPLNYATAFIGFRLFWVNQKRICVVPGQPHWNLHLFQELKSPTTSRPKQLSSVIGNILCLLYQ